MVESSQIATWANAVTVGRLLLSPLMFWVIPNHPRGSWIAFVLWLIFCAERRHRRLDRPPPRRDVGRRVPRSARRQGARARRDVHPRVDRRVLGGAGDHHRRPRGGHQRVPGDRRRPRDQRAGEQARQVQDGVPADGRRLRAAAARRRSTRRGCGTGSCGLRSCSPWSAARQYMWVARQMRPIDEATPVAGQVG